MPDGLLETVPEPVPASAIDNVLVGGGSAVKLAVTVVLLVRVKAQPPVPLHAPPHPAKADPAPGVAVRLTAWPGGKVAEH